MDIFGIIKNINNNLVLNKNIEEKIIKEINLKKDDLLKIKLNPAEDDAFYVLDDSSSSLLDEWLSIEGKDVPSEMPVAHSELGPLSEDLDPDKTEELTGGDDPFATTPVVGTNLDKEELDDTLEPFGSKNSGGIIVEPSDEEDDEVEVYKVVTTVRSNSLKNLISKYQK